MYVSFQQYQIHTHFAPLFNYFFPPTMMYKLKITYKNGDRSQWRSLKPKQCNTFIFGMNLVD